MINLDAVHVPFKSCCWMMLQVVYGAIAAVGGALLCSCTRIWNNSLKRMLAVLFTGLALMWLGLRYAPSNLPCCYFRLKCARR